MMDLSENIYHYTGKQDGTFTVLCLSVSFLS